MPDYGDQKYWDKRYQDQKTKTFDWLQDYNALKSIIEKVCTKESKILMLGCGNSLMSEDMYKDGYHHITNIDISEIVINQMNEMHKDLEPMTYEVMDCTELKYPDHSFDVVIDKSTIDALLCGADPDMMAAKTTKEVQRVLKVSGTYFVISYGYPEFRLSHFKMPHLSFEVEVMELTKQEANSKNTTTHHVYLCKKNPDADRISNAYWPEVEEDLRTGAEKRLTFAPKYTKSAGNELEGLEVKKEDYTGAGFNANEISLESDDEEFLNRIASGNVNDEEVNEILEAAK